MRGRWHILLGAIFTLVIWILSPNINQLYLAVILLASFLIDVDHYITYFLKTGNPGFISFFIYHKKKEIETKALIKKGIRKKGDFHLFHTIEFHLLIGLLSFAFPIFFYIFIAMVFHSLLDVIDLLRRGVFHRREYFFFKWLRNQF